MCCIGEEMLTPMLEPWAAAFEALGRTDASAAYRWRLIAGRQCAQLESVLPHGKLKYAVTGHAAVKELPPELQAALLGNHIVYLRGRLDEVLANTVIAQLLLMSRTSKPERGIDLYLDSPGGTLAAALSVYDMMQSLGVTVATTCIGTAGGAVVLVLASGTPGQRYALPHARIHLLDETVALEPRRASDVATQAEAVREQSARWRTALLRHVRIRPEQLVAELSAPRWLSAQEAQALGLIDATTAARRS
jgi:ATP-dependent Clp protease protease subunit